MHQKKEKKNPQSTLPYPRSVVINSVLMLFSEFSCERETAVALETLRYSGVPCAFHFTARSLNACRFKTAKYAGKRYRFSNLSLGHWCNQIKDLGSSCLITDNNWKFGVH